MMNSTVSQVSGWAVQCGFAEHFEQLVAQLTQQQQVTAQPYFTDPQIQQALSFNFNPAYVPLMPKNKRSRLQQLMAMIEQALAMAKLSADDLQGERVRCYLVGSGLRADLYAFFGHQYRNDQEDLLMTPQLKQLTARAYSQDQLAYQLLVHYQLTHLPISLFNTSCSAAVAVHLAHQALTHDIADVALVVGFSQFTLQDLFFLASQGMLADAPPQPFDTQLASTVLPADSNMAMVLQAKSAVQTADSNAVYLLASQSVQSRAQRSNSGRGYADFRIIASLLSQLADQLALPITQFAGYFPHGNGVNISDKAELMAVAKVCGQHTSLPIVSYKGQIGYFTSCSALLDIMLAAEALQQQRLIAFKSNQELDKTLISTLHADSPAMPLSSPYLLKSALGIDGSMVALALGTQLAG